LASLNPTTEELKMVSWQILEDSLVRSKLEEYYGTKINFDVSKEKTDEILNNVHVQKTVRHLDFETTLIEITLENIGTETLDDCVLIEAIPKSVIENIAEIRNPKPRIYDIIIKEDPIIQWRFREHDTAIVAWVFPELPPGLEMKLTYELEGLSEDDDHVSSIFVHIERQQATPTGNALLVAAKTELNDEQPNKDDNPLLPYILLVISIVLLTAVVFYVMRASPRPKESEIRALGEWVKKAKDQMTEDQIKNKLRATGWSEDIIEKLLK
jgi:hypothetical protein